MRHLCSHQHNACPRKTDKSRVTTVTCDAQGVAVISGAKANFYRYKSYLQTILEITDYIDHAVSNDGQYLAVFSGSSVIERTRVFDLYGTLEDDEYTSGGFTGLADGSSMASFLSKTGCFIPTSDSSFTRSEVDFPVNTGSADASDRDYYPSLATLRCDIDGNGGIYIEKVICSDGITAELSTFYDECMGGSVVVVDDPDTHSETDKLIAKWDCVTSYRGIVRGSFNAAGTLFTGTGSGDSPRYGTIALPDTFTMNEINASSGGGVSVGNYSGELALGDCLEYDDDGSIRTIDDCAGCTTVDGEYYQKYTATTSCGQEGELLIAVAELTISGADELDSTTDYESYSASGGLGPYSWEFSSGSIDDDGTLTAITDCSLSGEIAIATVTVTDSCGQTAELEVRLPGGAWVLTDSNLADKYGDTSMLSDGSGCSCGDCYANDFGYSGNSTGSSAYKIAISGSTKIVTYVSWLTEYWEWLTGDRAGTYFSVATITGVLYATGDTCYVCRGSGCIYACHLGLYVVGVKTYEWQCN